MQRLQSPEASSTVDLALGSRIISRKFVDRVNTPPSIDVASCTTSSLPMVRMTRFAGRRSLRVAELHFALSGGCLPAMVEFGRRYPPVGHAPKFRGIVFAVSRNEQDFGVFLPYWITPWAREELAARSSKQPCKEKKDQESRCCDFHGSRLASWYWTLHTRPPAQYFRPVTGCPSGSLTSIGSSYSIAATTVRARFLIASEAVCGAKCFRMKGTTASTACIISGKTS
jgi:hypothetical protein